MPRARQINVNAELSQEAQTGQIEKLRLIERLRFAAGELRAGRPVREIKLGAALVAWLSDASKTFEEQLGISFWQFGGSWRSIDARHRRDAALRELAATFHAEVGRWKAAGEIAEALEKYSGLAWFKDLHLKSPPHKYLGTGKELLWLVLKARDESLSQKQIFRILNTGSRDKCSPLDVPKKRLASRR